MPTVTAPQITDEEIDESARRILAQEARSPADRWYRQTPHVEEES